MSVSSKQTRFAAISAAAVVAAGALTATQAAAAECPAGKVGVDVVKPGPSKPSGVTDTVLASIDLAKEPIHADGRNLRLRKLVIQPGGIVPWHSHTDRPAIIYTISGSVTEYRSTCSVPIVHSAGDVTPEVQGTSHWWKNEGKKPAVLLSSDILHDASDQHMM